MNKNINILLNSIQDLNAFSDELERLEGEEYEKGLWDSTRPYGDLYDGLHMIYNYFPKTKEELQEIIKEKLVGEEDPNKVVNLNDIDVSEITDMSELFRFSKFIPQDGTTSYVFNNVDISKWDVSNVEDMSFMFYNYKNFNCDLSRWKVSKVEYMYYMFSGCNSFVGKGLERWNVSNVEDMSWMFHYCTSFNSNLKDWKVNNVEDMGNMFNECSSFNSDLSEWNVSKVESMRCMFYNCSSFNSDLSKWKDKVSKVEDMESMFYRCISFNSDLSEWNVSKVKDMSEMFYGCKSFTADLSGWDVSKVYNRHQLFNSCDKINQNGNLDGFSTLPNLPNEKCPKWVWD